MPNRGRESPSETRSRRVSPRISPRTVIRGISRAPQWPTPDRVLKLADITLKLGALFVAVLALGLLAAPKVTHVSTRIQAFIDVRDLQNRYIDILGKPAPYVVIASAREYNMMNERDILGVENTSAGVATPYELCSSVRDVVEKLFPGLNCPWDDPDLRLPSPSRGRAYERLLIANAADSLSIGELRNALLLMRDSEYIVARYTVRNKGGGYATNVRLSTPELFLPSDDVPFSLPPNRQYVVRFETPPGRVELDPKNELLAVNISYEPGGGRISTFGAWLVIFLLAILVVLTFLNADRESRRRASLASDGSERNLRT